LYILLSLLKEGIGMDATSESNNNPSEPNERKSRRQERIYEPFPVMLRTVDANGEALEIRTVLESFSASDLGLRLERRVDLGTKLFALVRLSKCPPEVRAPCVAVRGFVLHVEPQPDGTWGVAVRFTRYRFL
jgi:hypothetical protein